MKRTIILAGMLALVAVVVVYVYADGNSVSSPNQGGKGGCMMMGMDPNMMMNQCMNMMRNADISEDTIRQWQRMANTPLQMDDAAAILGQADALGLSQEQRQKLSDILKESREKAMNVLTEEQRGKMGRITDKPMTMMEMCQSMRGRMMQKNMGGMPGGGMMCPMTEKKAGEPEKD